MTINKASCPGWFGGISSEIFMTNHHKLLFLQNSDIPNHLSSDITRHTDYTFILTQSMQNKVIMQQNQCKGGLAFPDIMLAIPVDLFTKLADLIYAVKRLHQSTNDWRSLVSQCLLLFTVSLKFHLTEAPMSGFLTDFPTDFDPSDFSTDFLRPVAIHWKRIDL